ncbi:MAG: hypothetical protein ACXV3A_03035, partial [Kineosporiaceae bacterium]
MAALADVADHDTDAVLDDLHTALAAGLLRDDAVPLGSYRFAQPWSARRWTATTRGCSGARLHRRYAEAAERLHDDERACEVARHWVAAAMIIRVLDRLAGMLGHLPFAAMRKLLRFAVKGSPLPPERLAVLVSELQNNDPEFMRPGIHDYLRYLDRYGSVAARLCASAVPAWVVHGESGDGGMTGEERRTL